MEGFLMVLLCYQSLNKTAWLVSIWFILYFSHNFPTTTTTTERMEFFHDFEWRGRNELNTGNALKNNTSKYSATKTITNCPIDDLLKIEFTKLATLYLGVLSFPLCFGYYCCFFAYFDYFSFRFFMHSSRAHL